MRILFIGAHDWANIANRVAQGINAVARCARVHTTYRHPYGYQEDRFDDPHELSAWGTNCDWIISTGDGNYTTLNAAIQTYKPQRVATLHSGTAFRAFPAFYNTADRQFDRQFVLGDLYRLATKDAIPCFPPPATVVATLPPVPETIRALHAPSNRSAKGTEIIKNEVPHLDIINDKPFNEVAEALKRYPIFIDQINDLGGFGAAATEALGAGCVVLGSTRNIVERVDEFYPRPPILEVTQETLGQTVTRLIADRELLQQKRSASLQWAQTHATQTAVGKYWLKHLT